MNLASESDPTSGDSTNDFDRIVASIPDFVGSIAELKETLLAHLIMIGEIPAPTFGEGARVEFLKNRFTELGVESCSSDEKGNAFGLVAGDSSRGTILVLAHTDTPWPSDVDHSLTVREDVVVGPGLGDNSLGVATLLTLPALLEASGLRLKHDLLLMGASSSLGRGNLEGLRFFLSNTDRRLIGGVCVEGVRLGRLSYKSIGMVRGEITCSHTPEYDWSRFGASSAILTLNQVVSKIMEIPRPWNPRTTIALGSVSSGSSSFSSRATSVKLRFEVRSESSEKASEVWDHIAMIRDEVASDTGAEIELREYARCEPGGLKFSHPLVARTRTIMNALEIKPRVAPSTSELSALIDVGVPAVTLGIADGERPGELDEALRIDSMFQGVAQLLAVLLAIDGGHCDEH